MFPAASHTGGRGLRDRTSFAVDRLARLAWLPKLEQHGRSPRQIAENAFQTRVLDRHHEVLRCQMSLCGLQCRRTFLCFAFLFPKTWPRAFLQRNDIIATASSQDACLQPSQILTHLAHRLRFETASCHTKSCLMNHTSGSAHNEVRPFLILSTGTCKKRFTNLRSLSSSLCRQNALRGLTKLWRAKASSHALRLLVLVHPTQ